MPRASTSLSRNSSPNIAGARGGAATNCRAKPAACVESFRIAREVFAELDKDQDAARQPLEISAVIASEAKQSTSPRKEGMDCFASLAMTKLKETSSWKSDSSASETWA